MNKKKVIFSIFVVSFLIAAVGSQVTFDLSFETLKKKYAEPPSQFISVNDQKVHYRETGSGSPLVLLHGTSSSLHTWDIWAEELKSNYRVIRMDLPAFGLTGPNATHDYSLKAYSDFLRAFLDQVNVDTCYLAGNSLGGAIAWTFALSHPDRVKKLILIDPSGYTMERSPTLAFRLGRIPVLKNIMTYVTPRSLVEKSLKEVYGDPSKITEDVLDRYYDMTLAPGNRNALVARLNTPKSNTTQNMDRIQQPTLILWGEEDKWIPVAHADSFKRDIPHAKIITYESVGHLPMEEIPHKTAQDTRDFLIGNP